MSAKPFSAGGHDDPDTVAAYVAAADRRADERLATAMADIFLPERHRLDERTRIAILRMTEATVTALEREIAGHAARLLVACGLDEVAGILTANRTMTLDRLIEAGVLRDSEVMGEIIAQARIDLIDAALIANRMPGTAAALLGRLAESGDGVVRTRAVAYLVADGRRRLPAAERRAELPGELHYRLAWWIAAALRERLGAVQADGAIDRALVEATQRSIAAYDEGERVEAVAAQLAGAIDAMPADMPRLLLEALVEGRSILFSALLARALAVEPGDARALMLDGDSDRLWLALRALAFEREDMARIGWLLSEADAARDAERLADALDPVAALSPDTAALVVAPLAMPRDYRAALRTLARTRVS